MEQEELDLWWVAATNPLVSLPDLDRVKSAMNKCPLVVVSEAYADTETSHYARLLLPAAQWSEKAGPTGRSSLTWDAAWATPNNSASIQRLRFTPNSPN